MSPRRTHFLASGFARCHRAADALTDYQRSYVNNDRYEAQRVKPDK